MEYLIGIDIGTTGARTGIFRTTGQAVTSAFRSYETRHPQLRWAEQDPSNWWQAVVSSLREVMAGISPQSIKGIGISGQMHGLVLLDKHHRVLRPAIIWSDQRTDEQCRWITERVGKDKLIELACNPALPGFTAPKLLWVRDNEPQVYRNISTLLLPKDYIRFRLSGEVMTEISDAAGSLFFDVVNRRWSEAILSSSGIPREWLPPCVESVDLCGRVTREAAEEANLREGTPIVGGGADNACAAVGSGIVTEGLASSSIGTSGVIFAHSDSVKCDPRHRVHTFNHSVPFKWYLMGVMQAAGLSLRWLRDNFFAREREREERAHRDVYELMTEEAAQAPPGCQGLIFLPYLQGERTPHLDPYARGVFFGITPHHSRAHIIRAVMEGVAYGLKDSLDIVEEQQLRVVQVRLAGGGARSALWRQIQADVFGREVVTTGVEDAAAFGAALLAGVGVGVYASCEEACSNTVGIKDRIPPIPGNIPRYQDYHQLYGKLYHDLKQRYGELDRLLSRTARPGNPGTD
jgi:xylulokinase